jgi:hypothetical protein
MIKFTLLCDKEHAFEAWFASNDAYDVQVKRGLVECPDCGSRRVEKGLMAPNVLTTKRKTVVSPAGDTTTVAVPAQSVAMPAVAPQAVMAAAMMAMDPAKAEMMAKMLEFSRAVRSEADNVGKEFAEEARKIHFGETDARAIYGEATKDEVEGLLEDGVEIAPLMPLPEDRN